MKDFRIEITKEKIGSKMDVKNRNKWMDEEQKSTGCFV